ncbi:MAG TPA: hypothetical protein VFR58_11165 [Flavisolibacter sp.]|nr:hypothetical protein [Flavisolibacter sp.]
MSDSLKDILSNLNPDIDQELLLQYLQGKLSAEEQHTLEKQMMENDFESDALDGLQDFDNKQKIGMLVDQLNKDLRKRTDKKKKLRKKLRADLDPWLLVTIVIILLLVVIGYVLVRSQMGK